MDNVDIFEEEFTHESDDIRYVHKVFSWRNPNRWVKRIEWLREENGKHIYLISHYFDISADSD